MPDFAYKNLREPDETIQLPGVDLSVVDLGDLTVGRAIHHPGWRWSTHAKPTVGGEWCQVRHVGIVISGRMGIILSDGTTFEFEADDVFDIPPGHDGYTIGHEAAVLLEWAGIRAFAGFTGGLQNRVLVTLLATELIDSAQRARELGDAAWRESLSEFIESTRIKLGHFHGTEISMSEKGMLATFHGPAQALRCASEIMRVTQNEGLRMRAGVHVGEVEMVGTDVRGLAVHETERIMTQADEGEVFVSETIRALSMPSGLKFEERGVRTLDGLEGDWPLFCYVLNGDAGRG